MSLAPGSRLGPYEVVALIGSGGMGQVYRARDTKLHRDVALKVLPDLFATDPERLARFQREAQVLASLNHPNIAAIYGLEDADGVRALVLELVEGPTLADRLAQSGPIALDEALPIAKQMADALEAAHEHGIIHRDLKPANIKVRPDGTVKVLDFGLAKLALDPFVPTGGEGRGEEASESPTLSAAPTRVGVILGTAAYMSPEQARGKPVDKRADLWTFGCVLYEMLTGRQPFAGETVSDVLAKILKDDPDWQALPRGTPPEVRRGVRRCLEKDASRRPRDIRDLRLEMELPYEAAAASPALGRMRAWSRAGWIVATFSAFVAVILAGLSLQDAPDQSASVWLSINPPNNSLGMGSFAISPDGQRLAWVIETPAGESMLWVRALESSEGQILSGTDGAFSPFWSPDSRFLGFFAEGKLKKVEASGGVPQTLCDVRGEGRGASWSHRGLIVFAGGASEGLWSVSETGGQPVQVSTLNESLEENSHRWPHFLPDGRHFLFVARGSKPENHAVYVGSVETRETRRLLTAFSRVEYAPPGYVLFVREETLLAQRFDANRLEPAGEPVPVVGGVAYSRGTAGAAFSVSTSGVLIFRAAASEVGDQGLAWLDRNGQRLGVVGAGQGAALSPDERRVAVTRIDEDAATADIWLIDLMRENLTTRFSFDPRYDQFPVWSPDGSWIVFRSAREGNTRPYVKRSSGAGSEEPLQGSPSGCGATDWSTDGRLIILQCNGPRSREDIWYLPVEGDRKPVAYLTSDFAEAHGQLSPDGRWLAYMSDEAGGPEVYVQSFPIPEQKWKVSSNRGAFPKWRRDGTELFYVGGDRRLRVVTLKADGQFQFASPRALFDTGLSILRFEGFRPYDVTADGQRFLVPTSAGFASGGGASPLGVVLNWTAALEK